MSSPAEKLASEKRRKPRPKGTPRIRRRNVWVCGVRAARGALGLSMRDIGRAIGLSVPSIYEIEHGADLRLTTARTLADFFGLPVDDLWAVP